MLNIKKTKIFTAILSTTLLISGVYTTPVYAKGLSKVIKKEYSKILKNSIVTGEDAIIFTPHFQIADINNDGKEDLILETFRNSHGDTSYDIYLNSNNKKIIKAKVGGFGFEAGESIKSYKNYVMAVNWHLSDVYFCSDCIYKTDKNGNFKEVYKRYYTMKQSEEDWNKVTEIKKDNQCIKIVNGKEKKISRKEYNNFASKFKEVKGKWYKVSLNNIRKYVK